MRIFIGCSSSSDIPSKYLEDCKKFLNELFILDNDLVFGACNNGLMGVAYNIALENKKNIVGIYPEVYEYEARNLLCEKIPTNTVNDRTSKLIENSDALIFLPGGVGTVYELFTAIENKRGHEFDKPIIIYNSCGYYDKLIDFVNLMSKDNFVSKEVQNCYYICDNAKDTITYMNTYYDKIGKIKNGD